MEMGDITITSLLLGVVFGSVGMGFFIYGKKQGTIVPLLCGLTLMVLPYFISSTLLLFVVGAVLVAVPYFVRA